MGFRSISFSMAIALISLSATSGQVPLPKKTDLALKVVVHPAVAKDEVKQKVHQEVADLLNKGRIGVPNDRILYFQNLPTPTTLPFGGWSGMIEKITHRENGGFFIVLGIKAIYSGAHDTNMLYERYSVLDGKIKYLGCSIPPSANYPYVQIGK